MPASLADFAKAEKTVTVPFDGTDLTVVVTYRRWSWRAGEVAAGETYVQWFARHVAGWDLAAADGQPLAFDEASLNLLDRGILDVVIAAVEADRRPNPTTATP
jgi:hypothetical protein